MIGKRSKTNSLKIVLRTSARTEAIISIYSRKLIFGSF
jgi:hypothetical protein